MERDTADWLARQETAGVPASPVLSIGDMLTGPQLLAYAEDEIDALIVAGDVISHSDT